MFELNYIKHKNEELFASFKNFDFEQIQNYIPIFNLFFSLNENNYNKINLENSYYLKNVIEKEKENIYKVHLQNNLKKRSFFKFSPLFDPIKYLMGKYETHADFFDLPNLLNKNNSQRSNNANNSAYTDSFFCFLSSKLLDQGFLHGLEFYGSFVSLKEKFHYNIFDDFDLLNESEFFHTNLEKKFNIDQGKIDFFYGDSKKHRKKLDIGKEVADIEVQPISTCFENFEQIFSDNKKLPSYQELIYNSEILSTTKNVSQSKHSSSTCSSRTSNTSNENSDSNSEDDDYTDDDSIESNKEEEENLQVIINKYPVNVICLESLDNTLDAFIEQSTSITIMEWKSILFQILIILTTFQKIFNFTHNDLHSNNIMYKSTEKKFLCYKYNGKFYKVPTFGKIIKLIDFGRAIYNFRDQLIYSDSFDKKGDAASQYNFGPIYNPKKTKIMPNFSFDLTRLACSLYDHFVPYHEERKKIKNPITKLIIKWCMDDFGKHILYKKNGIERYPDFKLYKMIARNVHNHIPAQELLNPIFNDFIVGRKQLKKKKIICIDKYEKCYQ
uniref:Protein kinase domain-containing protein n=1 Tax=uncultured marine group II/III euryarchaeote AD1000_88_G11 TaxID=1457822 RepID=A0A075FYZ3_9EURY|nr:hypothetical protein [uncultured marine group II/III euryarchaeote AD1000_88_G11]